MMRRLAITTLALLALASAPVLVRAHGHGSGHGHGGGHGRGGGGQGGGNGQCEAARCAVQAAIDQACPCAAATNHGRYVRCVAHARKILAANGTLPRRCKGRVVSCAARSTCGLAGAVTCEVPDSTCTSGTCADDPSMSCTQASDCGTSCSVASSASACQSAGGTVGTGTSCCPNCPASPSGAFLDAGDRR